MGKHIKELLICAGVSALVVTCIVIVIFLLHGRNSEIAETVNTTYEVEETTVIVEPSTVDRAALPQENKSVEEAGVSVTISEDAAGLRQETMLEATVDYCTENSITGDVLISDADFVDGVFYLTLETNQGVKEFSFRLEDYV